MELSINQKLTNQVKLRETNVSQIVILGALLYRSILNTIRNPMMIRAKFIQLMLMALYIGGIFFNAGKRDYTKRPNFQALNGYFF